MAPVCVIVFSFMCLGAGIYMLLRPSSKGNGKDRSSIVINVRVIRLEISNARQGVILIAVGAVLMMTVLLVSDIKTEHKLEAQIDVAVHSEMEAASEDLGDMLLPRELMFNDYAMAAPLSWDDFGSSSTLIGYVPPLAMLDRWSTRSVSMLDRVTTSPISFYNDRFTTPSYRRLNNGRPAPKRIPVGIHGRGPITYLTP